MPLMPWMARKVVDIYFDSSVEPAQNLVREDELFRSVEKGDGPEIVGFWVDAPCLVKGKAKSAKYGWYRESLAEQMGITVLERVTGGGVVYHDEGNLNWSFMTRSSGLLSPTKMYGWASDYMVKALASLGVRARFSPPNRIDVDGHKVSGLAARSTPRAFLVHGTLLLNSDLEKLNSLCIPPPGCPPVANLNRWVPRIKAQQVVDAVIEVLRDSGLEVKIV